MFKRYYTSIDLPEKLKCILDDLDIELNNESSDDKEVLCIDEDTGHISFNSIMAKGLPKIDKHQCFINRDLLGNALFDKVIEQFIANKMCLRADACYQGVLIKNYTLKIIDRASYGLYSDIICSQGKQFAYNTRKIRNVSNLIFLMLDRMNLMGEVSYPIDTDYGRSQDIFFTQFSCSFSDKVNESLLMKSLNKTFKECDFVVLSLDNKLKKIIIRHFWVLNSKITWPSLFVFKQEGVLEKSSHSEATLVETKIDTTVEEDVADNLSDIYDEKSAPKRWKLLRRILLASIEIKKKNIVEGKAWPDEIESTFLRKLIEEIDPSISFDSFNKEELDVLIGSLSDDDVIEAFEKIRYTEMIEIDPRKYMNSIYENVSDIDVLDMKKAFDEKDVNSIVKGEAEDLDENHTQLVKGSGSNSNDNSVWEVKKLKVTEKLKNEYSQLSNPTPAHIENTLSKTLKEELSNNDEKIESFVDDIVDAITEELLPEAIPNSKFINKTLVSLKNKTSDCQKSEMLVPTLDVKVMLSFTEKLIRKGQNYQDNLKKDEENRKNKTASLSGETHNGDAIIFDQLKKTNENLLIDKNKLQKEKNDLKAEILHFKREMLTRDDEVVSEQHERVNLIDDKRQEIIDKLSVDIKASKAESLEYRRQLKINENEMVKLKTLVARIHNKGTEDSGGGSGESGRKDGRIKKLEKMNEVFQDGKAKVEKELAERKSELYSSRLEVKTMTGKVKQLEKKIEILSKRKAG